MYSLNAVYLVRGNVIPHFGVVANEIRLCVVFSEIESDYAQN